MNNRIHNSTNPHQGAPLKVLTVCSAGLLRSPTVASVLNMYGCNTRAAGCIPDFALIPVDDVLIAWADVVICMEEGHAEQVKPLLDAEEDRIGGVTPNVLVLEIPDNFAYRDPRLVEAIEKSLPQIFEFFRKSGYAPPFAFSEERI